MKLKNKLFLVAFVLAFTFLNAQVQTHKYLSVSGTQLVDSNNKPIVLRGMSFGWHSMWPRFYN